MNTLGYSDLLLLALAVLAPLWCVGLALYVLISDSRSQAASLRATTKAFSKRLSEHGKTL
jgi:hypothetical protein